MLSEKAIQALRPAASRAGTKHHDRDGPYLWVARSGSRTWRKDYRWEGKLKTFTIGPYPQVRLANARRRAIDIAEWLREGIDPRSQSPSRRSPAQTASYTCFREVAAFTAGRPGC